MSSSFAEFFETGNKTLDPPVVYVTCIKELRSTGGSGAGGPKYKGTIALSLEDGVQQYPALFVSQLDKLVSAKQLSRGSKMKLVEYTRPEIPGIGKIVIIAKVDVLSVPSDPPAPLPASQPSPPPSSLVEPPAKKHKEDGEDDDEVGNSQQIRGLSSLTGGLWKIVGTVTAMSDLKPFKSRSGPGKMFTFHISDGPEPGDEIKMVAFGDVAEKVHPTFSVGRRFSVSKGKICPSNKQFNKLPHEYEVILAHDTEIKRVSSGKNAQPPSLTFRSISYIEDLAAVNETVSVVGMVAGCSGVESFVAKSSGKEVQKRSVVVCDASGNSLEAVLWGSKFAVEVGGTIKPRDIVALHGFKVGCYKNARNVSSAGFSSRVVINPADDLDPEIAKLKSAMQPGNLQRVAPKFAPLLDLASKALGSSSDTGEWTLRRVSDMEGPVLQKDTVKICAVVLQIRHEKDRPVSYSGCPASGCGAKAVLDPAGSGLYVCGKCGLKSETAPQRYNLSVMLGDYSGICWVSCFDEVGRMLMGGTTADQMSDLRDMDAMDHTSKFDSKFWNAQYKTYEFVLRRRIQQPDEGEAQRNRRQHGSETSVQCPRVRVTACGAHPLDDFVKASEELLSVISSYDSH